MSAGRGASARITGLATELTYPSAASFFCVRFARIGGDVVNLQFAGQDRFASSIDRHHLRLPSVVEKRFHRLADDDLGIILQQAVRRVDACPIEDRVKDAPRADGRVADAICDARTDQHEWNMHRGLIQQIAVLLLAMLAESFAVIADEHDRDRPFDLLLKRSGKTPELCVHRRNFAVVRLLRILAAERLRRRVGKMGIVVMDPEKKRGVGCRVSGVGG
jgi:hypothetical protein